MRRLPTEINPADPRAALYAALWEMTETYWGVNDARNGDGGSPPACIRQARKALRDTATSVTGA